MDLTNFSCSVDSQKPFIYTHRKLAISYNGNQIIHVNMTMDNLMPIENAFKIPMTFELVWFPTEHPFKDRFDNYLDANLFEHQVDFTFVSPPEIHDYIDI